MALPKRRTSKSRRDMRRTHWKLAAPSVTKCPECGDPKMPHRVCPNCGKYKGRTVIEGAE
jgi:large subunit ribosomal protein L32